MMFFGWYVLAGIFIVQMYLVGFYPYSASLLVVPIVSEFGATVEQVMYSMTMTTCLGLIVIPLAGVMIDRYPVRWLMAGGTLIFAGGLGLLSRVNSIYQYIILFGATMALGNGFLGVAICSSTVSRWFTRNRGKALGISAMGAAVGGMVIPALTAYWIGNSGWRGMLENMALLALLAVLPIVILSIRGFPAEIGLEPEKSDKSIQGVKFAEVQLSIWDIIKKPDFWLMGIILGLIFSIFASLLANLTPYVKSVGIDISKAPNVIMTVAVASLAGTLIFGMASDKLSLKTGLWLAICGVIGSLLIMATEPSFFVVEIAVALLGLMSGGIGPVWGAMVARVFGLLSYGKAMGLMQPLIAIIVMPSYFIVGRLFDISGSYRICLYVFSVVAVVAMLALIPLRLDGAAYIKSS